VSGGAACEKRVLIIAGPNGAGKTTFAREFLTRDAGFLSFANADLIAAGLAPFDPSRAAIRAGRIMLQQIEEHVARGEDFAFETTLAGRGYARAIPRWRASGYRIALMFLSLPSPEVAILRVQTRVRQGGHAVPEEVIRRRFRAGLLNFQRLYKPLVDTWALYDSSFRPPALVDWGETP
jgi:predicted ABC-type ATPase